MRPQPHNSSRAQRAQERPFNGFVRFKGSARSNRLWSQAASSELIPLPPSHNWLFGDLFDHKAYDGLRVSTAFNDLVGRLDRIGQLRREVILRHRRPRKTLILSIERFVLALWDTRRSAWSKGSTKRFEIVPLATKRIELASSKVMMTCGPIFGPAILAIYI
jgi:hypothetical protein